MDYSQKSSKKAEKNNEIAILKYDASGHRKRVKEKFMKQDVSYFPNQELIEALLFFCNSRRDVKKESQILDKLSGGSILKLLFLEEVDLEAYGLNYIKSNFLFLIKVMREAISRYFKDKIPEVTFEHHEAVSMYLISRSAYLYREELRVLFLNAKNKLIDDLVVSRGTVNETAIYPREIVSMSTNRTAVSIIISHNHPSGELKASEADLQMTYDLKDALKLVGVELQDHVIVAGNRSFSFKKEGLL